jgi:Skp family chaperone for outer membrane proteins
MGPGCLVSANRNEENRTVKRTVITLTAMAALGATAYLGSQLRAQNPQQYTGQVQQATATAPVKPLTTRVAIINLQQVIKQYRKWTDFEQNYKNAYQYYNAEFEKRKTQGVSLKSQLDKTADDATKDKIQQQLKDLERQVQDLGETAKKQLGKMRDEQAVQIYREVEEAVQHYARANDIEMVLHYNDAIVPADMYNAVNIERKLQTGACMPMYSAPGMNITDTIAMMLNQRLGATAAPAAPSAQH